MNAVLVELGQPDDPIAVYNKIQAYQEENILKVNPDSTVSKYLLDSQLNDTKMSLPSGICGAFKNYVTDRIVTVCYNSDFAKSDFEALIIEECARITALGMTVKIVNPDDGLSKIDWTYVLVLVNGSHWIAVKRIKVEKDDIFICYDPATGEAETGDSMITAMQKLKYEPDSINGLYICIP